VASAPAAAAVAGAAEMGKSPGKRRRQAAVSRAAERAAPSRRERAAPYCCYITRGKRGQRQRVNRQLHIFCTLSVSVCDLQGRKLPPISHLLSRGGQQRPLQRGPGPARGGGEGARGEVVQGRQEAAGERRDGDEGGGRGDRGGGGGGGERCVPRLLQRDPGPLPLQRRTDTRSHALSTTRCQQGHVGAGLAGAERSERLHCERDLCC
jgi:hypothetical protein